MKRIREILGDRAEEFTGPWVASIRPLAKAEAALRGGALEAAALAKEQTSNIAKFHGSKKQSADFSALVTLRATYAAALDSYKVPAATLLTALNETLDAQSDTVGWQDFLHVALDPNAVRVALIDRTARTAVGKEFDAALKHIDRAREQVLDDKFLDFSAMIQVWWERLRPDEQTFFSAVEPRAGTKRTIDFKAGLSPNPDRSGPTVRDVIAVFSHSQLYCLGLAMFLARAQHEGIGFIILDDPVLASDEDYQIHFNSTVLSELLKLPIQVVVLTQIHRTWTELESLYRHLGISTAQLISESPAAGTVIENTSNSLRAMITRAKSLAHGGHPDVRKTCGMHLRDAGERFCKEMLVEDRRLNGDLAASLADYDGKTLEWLCPHVDPLLDHDAAHPGKLSVFKSTVNNACHDNPPPGTSEMAHACGEIGYFVKEYLGR